MNVRMPSAMNHLMGSGKDDLQKMDELKQSTYSTADKAQFLESGEPIQPILEAIEDELHRYFGDYCEKNKLLDLLLSF